MSGFTDWFSVNIVGIVTYVIGWYTGEVKKEAVNSNIDSEEEWGQFVIIDEEKYLNIFYIWEFEDGSLGEGFTFVPELICIPPLSSPIMPPFSFF